MKSKIEMKRQIAMKRQTVMTRMIAMMTRMIAKTRNGEWGTYWHQADKQSSQMQLQHITECIMTRYPLGHLS